MLEAKTRRAVLQVNCRFVCVSTPVILLLLRYSTLLLLVGCVFRQQRYCTIIVQTLIVPSDAPVEISQDLSNFTIFVAVCCLELGEHLL